MRLAILVGLLSVGLLAGCGGVEADAEEEVQLSTREDALDLCAATYHVKYYSDATYTTQVGREICLVCNRQVGRSGVKSQFREWINPLQLCEPF